MPSLPSSPKVLIAPLDWGLGHATRCIPVIHQLLRDNCQVVIAASGAVEVLLRTEFPDLRFIPLFGYNIRYASAGQWLPLKMILQIPWLLSAIRKENKWLRQLVATEAFDAVISDNRYGLHHPKLPCAFITHQLRIKSPFRWMENLLQRINYRLINRFTECWVPDAAEAPTLAEELSHPARRPRLPVWYTGPLSRFSPGAATEKKHLLILLSGPEPQRTLLEKDLLRGLKTYKEPVVMVRGLPAAKDGLALGNNVTVYNHLPAAKLAALLHEASFVIARCGYSTVMDLAATGSRGILIPTPGQTEQEYLAKHLTRIGFAFCLPQAHFDLKMALDAAETFPYQPYPNTQADELKKVAGRFLQSLATSA